MGGIRYNSTSSYNPWANIYIYNDFCLLNKKGIINSLTINHDAISKDLLLTFRLTNNRIDSINHNYNFAKYHLYLKRNNVITSPKFFISHPPLKVETPHLNYDGSICLYHPDFYQWEEYDSIIEPIFKWLYFWVYFYETWLIFGKWYGPEIKH